MTEVNRRWSPYRYAYNNPLRFIDPDGMLEDNYSLDDNGNVSLTSRTEDEKDRLLDKESGEIISEGVDKGLLEDGQNIMENGLETTNIKGGTKLSIDISMKSFDEMGGTVFEDGAGANYLKISSYKHSTLTRNENGEVTQMLAGFDLPTDAKYKFTSIDGSFTGIPKYSFHTHPGHPDGPGLGYPVPSGMDFGAAWWSGIPQVIYGAKTVTMDGQTGNMSRSYLPKITGWNGKTITGTVPKTEYKMSGF